MESRLQEACIHEVMESRLQEACLNGDVAALRELLGEDTLALDRAMASASIADGPLHLAALLGHADLAMEIVTLKPELARERNARGSYPLHLASAKGHRPVVEALLRAGADLCLLRDGYGYLPIHIAVLKGRLDITEALVGANKEAARALTTQGESVLHLGARSNSVEVVRLLVERLELDEDEEFLNLKDERGNTALHVATARKQVQTLKFLVSKSGVDVNATNERGATALAVLLELPCERGDLLLGEIIFSAGGRETRRGSPVQPGSGDVINSPPVEHKKFSDDRVNYTPTTLMLVAVLIATVTFQAGIQPPGGFRQNDAPPSENNTFSTSDGFDYMADYLAGEAVLSQTLLFKIFMTFDMAGLFASMSIILLFICVLPHRRRKLMKFLVWIMWIAVFCTTLAFISGVRAAVPEPNPISYFLLLWLAVLVMTVLWQLVRFIIYLLRMILGKKNPRNVAHSGSRASVELVVVGG